MQIPISEAKPRLSELAEIAAAGEEIVLTVHGEPKARLTPLAAPEGPSWAEIMRPVNDLRGKIKPRDFQPNPVIASRRRRQNVLRGLR
jgi:prevent-host-death family protein